MYIKDTLVVRSWSSHATAEFLPLTVNSSASPSTLLGLYYCSPSSDVDLTEVDKKESVRCVFFDLSKAFDSLPHWLVLLIVMSQEPSMTGSSAT